MPIWGECFKDSESYQNPQGGKGVSFSQLDQFVHIGFVLEKGEIDKARRHTEVAEYLKKTINHRQMGLVPFS